MVQVQEEAEEEEEVIVRAQVREEFVFALNAEPDHLIPEGFLVIP